ncbi:O-linked N-acetylglucosamine transferase family protein [Burkholderia cepacia]|uniref:O-linked N-acetylglucosamine transferase family protein n=1 Tax=Burkholderia cepacia TaxID=292 RepID=UPI000F5F6BB3|nr:tetratricopeptide repeat protein [Burkholderia cepacia]RQZ90181.1 hypothetical protein DF055_38400 [Burkholderia cepacia]RQZ95534.1 hypothetical protein DF054_38370 [Burkholderia cepacia]
MEIVKLAIVELVRLALNENLSKKIGTILTPQLLDSVCNADLYYLAGNIKLREGDYSHAISLYQRACELAPHWSDPFNNLGVCFERQNLSVQAYENYAIASNLAPDDRLAARNAAYAAFLLVGEDKYRHLAMKHLSAYLEHHPDDGELRSKLAYIQYYLGEDDKAIENARRSVELNPENVAGIFQKVALRLPVVYSSDEQIDVIRLSIDRALSEMECDVSVALRRPAVLAEQFRDIWCDALFYLTYNGRMNVDLLNRFNDQVGRVVQAAFGDAEQRVAENLAIRKRQAGKSKIRIAFVSAYVYGHSIWKIPMCGFYENLDRDLFEIYTYHMGKSADSVTEYARSLSDSFCQEAYLGDVISQLEKDAPDVIVFTDVGMNFSSYCLTCLKLAPLQLQMLGHPETSGSAKVDYVVSPAIMESPDAKFHYREDVFLLPGLGCVYSFDYPRLNDVRRSYFDLDDSDFIVLSPQSTFKYVPCDDDLYPEIAAKVGNRCKFVFLARADDSHVKIFEDRLKKAFQRHGLSYDRHVKFIRNKLSHVDFVRLNSLSDVFLDNPSWSGHNTVLDALHGNALVVCMSGTFMRQRHASAIMQYLDFPELVAKNKDGLIELIDRYATNSDYVKWYKEMLPQRLKGLVNKECVSSFEEFIVGKVQG